MTVSPTEPLIGMVPRVVPCREYGVIGVAPEDALGPDGHLLINDGVLNRYVRADFKDNTLRLSAMGISGLIPLTKHILLQVKPRFPLRNLTHMVSVCGYSPTILESFRTYSTSATWSDWSLNVLTDALLQAFRVITQNGLLRTYHRRSEVSSYPHGRIDVTATVLHLAARGVSHQAEYSWFERSSDNPANQCLKLAAMILHDRHLNSRSRLQGETRAKIGRLGEMLRVLSEVKLEERYVILQDPQVRGAIPLPQARTYYRPALDVAVAIVSEKGIDLDIEDGSLSLPSMLVKTEDLFEEFVRISLRDVLRTTTDIVVLDGNKPEGSLCLYEALQNKLTLSLPSHTVITGNGKTEPDIVMQQPDGRYPLVIDIKYTEVQSHAARSEVEQVILYGVRYSSPAVMTVHPLRAGTTKGLHISGQIGDLLVCQYRIDLSADDLEAEMTTMGHVIGELISSDAIQDQLRAPA